MLVHRAANTISVAVDGHRGRVLLLGWGNPLGAASPAAWDRANPRCNYDDGAPTSADGTDTVHLLTHPEDGHNPPHRFLQTVPRAGGQIKNPACVSVACNQSLRLPSARRRSLKVAGGASA
jgi:hypothetical protein